MEPNDTHVPYSIYHQPRSLCNEFGGREGGRERARVFIAYEHTSRPSHVKAMK